MNWPWLGLKMTPRMVLPMHEVSEWALHYGYRYTDIIGFIGFRNLLQNIPYNVHQTPIIPKSLPSLVKAAYLKSHTFI
jgi:hypothetical protein